MLISNKISNLIPAILIWRVLADVEAFGDYLADVVLLKSITYSRLFFYVATVATCIGGTPPFRGGSPLQFGGVNGGSQKGGENEKG